MKSSNLQAAMGKKKGGKKPMLPPQMMKPKGGKKK
jgi:hypothetical protein